MENKEKVTVSKARTFVLTMDQIETLGKAEELEAFKRAVEIAPELRVPQLLALARGLKAQTKLKV